MMEVTPMQLLSYLFKESLTWHTVIEEQSTAIRQAQLLMRTGDQEGRALWTCEILFHAFSLFHIILHRSFGSSPN